MQLRNLRRFFLKSVLQPKYALRVFKSRIVASSYYNFSHGQAASPEAITLFLTHICNLHCKMCGQWGEAGITKKLPRSKIYDEVTIDEYKILLDAVKRYNPNITLFGGEPLLYSRCIDLIRLIKERSLHCVMITNGSLLDNLAEELIEYKLDELNISLDGDGDLHDAIRGMSGIFEKIIHGIKKLQFIKIKKGTKFPLINLQCTINRYNYTVLDRILRVAEDIHADSLTYHNLIFLRPEEIERQKDIDKLLGCSSYAWEGFLQDAQIDPEKLFLGMNQIFKDAKRLNIDLYPNFSLSELRRYYKDQTYLPKEYKARCLSPWIVAYVFPDGDVRPCLNCDYSFGNIKNDNFYSVWNSKAAVYFRSKLKEQEIFPMCVRCSELYRY